MKKDVLYPLRKLHGHFHEYKLHRKARQEFYKSFINPIQAKLKANPNIVFLVLTPEHGNMGDHAIAVSEIRLLHQLNAEYIEITGHMLGKFNHFNFLKIMNGYPIIINGGGNMGTLWFDAERLHRAIIKSNPSSPIFIMPNTIYYEDSSYGKDEFEKSLQIYNQHKHLYLFAREHTSFNIMSQAYRNVKLIPDMVLALDESRHQQQRHGCLLCLRVDREKTIDETTTKEIWKQAASIFGPHVKHTDMNIGKHVPITQRESTLEEKYAEFRGAELVVTDRLHGMIFCAITGTPCIVINSKSPKVRGCYEWVKNLEYIKFAENITEISEIYRSIPQRNHTYDATPLIHYYEDLQEQIASVLYGG